MNIALTSLFLRDFKLAFRVGGGVVTGILFFFTIAVMIPFAIGPNINLLSQIGPAILWIGALLAALLGQDRLFLTDQEDGSLDIIRMSGQPLELVVLIKCAAHWAATGLPLILIVPILSFFLNLTPTAMGITILTLLVGTPALTLIGGTSAAITTSLQKGGLLQAILIIPFAIPVLIFGVSTINLTLSEPSFPLTPFLLLCAISLVSLVVGPFTAALAIKKLHAN